MSLHTPRRLVAVLAILLGLMSSLVGMGTAQEQDGAVHVIPINGEIDLGIAPFLDRALDEAEEAGAAAVLLDIDTPGGRLDAVLQMRDSLLATPVHTIAHIDPTAFSAGALVALAANEIYFAPAGVMGAATPVVGSADGATETADPKVVSAVRSTFRATAEQRNRDPLVAEAMVDESIEIDGITAEGRLLTLTAMEAEVVGYSEGVATDRDELLGQLGLGDRTVVEASPTLAERTVRFITNPLLGSLLVTLGVLLIIGELLAGTFGLGSAIGVALLGTFFYGHLLAGLAGWEDVVLVGIGIVLIGVELFVVPGFGVPGVLGLAAVLGGSYLAMIGRDLDFVSASRLWATAGTVALTFVAIGIGLIAFLTFLGRRQRAGPDRPGTGASESLPAGDGSEADDGGRRVASARTAAGDVQDRRGWLRWFGTGDVLDRETDRHDDDAPAEPSTPSTAARQGAVGVALTDLRPAGVASFDGHRVDVVTEGNYVKAGERVEVLRAERYRRVVRRTPDGDPVRS